MQQAVESGAVAHVAGVQAQPPEALAQLRHGRRVAAAVVVEDDDGAAVGVAEVVQALEGHAAGQGPVTDHRHDAAVVLGPQLERLGEPVGVAEDGRGVAVLDPVVVGLGPRRVARQAARLPQVVELVAAAGDHLVDVGLVAGVPQQDVAGRVEHPVHGEGQLDHTQVGAQVTVVGLDGPHDLVAHLAGELVELLVGEPTEVCRVVDRLEEHAGGSVTVDGGGYRTPPSRDQTYRSGRSPAHAAAEGGEKPWSAGDGRAGDRRGM